MAPKERLDMANMLDYIDWFGTCLFSEVAFNEVDAMLFAQISYVDFHQVVPTCQETGKITIKQACAKFFSLHEKEEIYEGCGLINPLTPFILQKMAGAPRYQNIELSHYSSRYDELRHEQFAALAIHLPSNTTFISYRGTDDTLAGWREDFMISFQVVAAQKDAVEYLEAIAKDIDGTFMLAGHSKGGNLAAYAGLHVDTSIQKRIVKIWSMDSPGFSQDLIDKTNMKALEGKWVLYTPRFSVVGSLMYQNAEEFVVLSDQTGLLQHDPFSWQVMGRSFIKADEINQNAKDLNKFFEDIINTRSEESRRAFTNAIFDAIGQSGATTLSQLSACTPNEYGKILSAINQGANQEDRTTIKKIVLNMIKYSASEAVVPLQDKILSITQGTEDTQKVASIEDYLLWKENRFKRDFQNFIKKIIPASTDDEEK